MLLSDAPLQQCCAQCIDARVAVYSDTSYRMMHIVRWDAKLLA